ncbi:vancomycin high temperature exclusion protein [Vibrio artabrorum]|uniref:ElyC/SanA/YdcF family protein n=1 Tax=Vibrio artabrorum TaxID=446374 RepID=A0ABT8CII2_9VIBR|nr:ElyC/SanA/YdcF family protein [Vibrio artabrorum]MDN3701527.1 ElyC/SanA/YdcF family protein [Vibrio artabrorum]
MKSDSHSYRKYLLKTYPKLKTCLFGAFLVFLVGCASVIAIDYWVSWQAKDRIIYDIDDVPKVEVAVVLGTSKYLGRTLNDYYKYRIESAIELFEHKKVNQFLLSGDNAHRSYNEPWTMKRDLLRAGVPEERINLDYAGFRTLDSIVRAKKIFDTDNFLIITQKFHCERALLIASSYDIHAQCLAVSGPTHHSGSTIRLREVFARTKAFLDLYIMGTTPKFLGPKEPIQPNPKQEPLPIPNPIADPTANPIAHPAETDI